MSGEDGWIPVRLTSSRSLTSAFTLLGSEHNRRIYPHGPGAPESTPARYAPTGARLNGPAASVRSPYLRGTTRWSSVNQFCTTPISVSGFGSGRYTIRKRRPSGEA